MGLEDGRIAEGRSSYWKFVSVILLIALIIRLMAAVRYQGFIGDQIYFIHWMDDVWTYGWAGAYRHDDMLNYPPLFVLFLGFYKMVLHAIGITPTVAQLSIKFPMIVIDIAAAIGYAALVLRQGNLSVRAKIAMVAFFALNPAFVIDGAVWGQVDMMHSFLLAASVYFVSEKPGRAGILFALAMLTKFQSVMAGPVLLAYLLRCAFRSTNRSWHPFKFFSIGFLSMLAPVCIYFQMAGQLGSMLSQGYLNAVGTFSSVTMNAMNIWFYLVGLRPDTPDYIELVPFVTPKAIGMALLGLAMLVVMTVVFLAREVNRGSLLRMAAGLNFAFFMLPTEMHERYGIPALVLALFATISEFKWLKLAWFLTLSMSANLVIVLTKVTPASGMWIVVLNGILFYHMMGSIVSEIPKAFWSRVRHRIKTEFNIGI